MGLLAHERAALHKTQPPTIGQWHFSIAHFNATDPRDRAYALYGLDGLAKEFFVLQDHPLTTPEYDKSVLEVIQSLTIFILSKLKAKLAGLHFLTAYGANGQGNFPSWVPRLDQSYVESGPRLYSIALVSEWHAGGDLAVQIHDDDPVHCLALKGIAVSYITSVLSLDIHEDHFPQWVKSLYKRAARETISFGVVENERRFKNVFMRALTADQRQTEDQFSQP